MAKNNRFLNYTLSVGFIFLIVSFLVLMILVSRLVFEDGNVLKEHVSTAQTLLNDINEVQNNLETTQFLEKSSFYNGFSPFEEDVVAISYTNFNKDSSMLTLKFDSEINKMDKYYYFEIDNLSSDYLGNTFLYEIKGDLFVGKLFDVEEEIKMINYESKDIDVISEKDVIGKLILRFDGNKVEE